MSWQVRVCHRQLSDDPRDWQAFVEIARVRGNAEASYAWIETQSPARLTSRKKRAMAAGKFVRFQGDRRPRNGNNPPDFVAGIGTGQVSVIRSRIPALLLGATGALVVLQPMHAHAQWWSRAPADFEECADAAEKAPAKEERTSALAECNAKFAGRRKPDGGYTYYDFMQDRTFDIAGPNPTLEEQKKIDEQYAIYLENQRRSNIAAAFAAKQQQMQEVQPVSVCG
jgi:hypothetical protein